MNFPHLLTALALSGLSMVAYGGQSGQSDQPGRADKHQGHESTLGSPDLSFASQSHHEHFVDTQPVLNRPSPNCIPEPGTIGMLALGLLGIGFIRARATATR